jgi:hypothetical protein
MENDMPKETPFDEFYHCLIDQVKLDTIPLGGSTPYTQLKDIVAGYGRLDDQTLALFASADTVAERDIYVAALDEYRGREADFTADDLKRVMDAAGRA